MKKFWYLPIAAAVGAASLTVWAQANAGPPPAVSPGVVVVADVKSGSDPVKTEDSPALLPTPTPTASITAIPDHAAPATQLIPAELQTYPPVQTTDGPTHDAFDDKGGLRDAGVSDDGPTHDLNDDKGGLREANVSDDGPGDDKGGLRDSGVSDDGPGDDKGGNR